MAKKFCKAGIAVSICTGAMTPRHHLALLEFWEDRPTGWEQMHDPNFCSGQTTMAASAPSAFINRSAWHSRHNERMP
jgi:hypothetical protein